MFKAKPSGQRGQRAKMRHGFCRYCDTRFNLDSHVVAVAENIMDAATLRVFDLNHAPKSGMKAADCDEHCETAGLLRKT